MSKKLPKYKEIEQDILSQIQSGRLKPGDQVMTEMELCNTYKVSRMTAHKALESLAVRGVVHRIAGKGTFVAAQNQDFIREEHLRIAEKKLMEVADIGKEYHIPCDQMVQILRMFYEEE